MSVAGYEELRAASPGKEAVVEVSFEGSPASNQPSNNRGSYIVILGLRGGKLVTLGSEDFFVDAGIHVGKVSFVGGLVRVRGQAAGPSDANCCPSMKHDSLYRVVKGRSGASLKRVSRRMKKVP